MTMAWECPKNCTIHAWNQEIVTTSGGKSNGTQKQVSAFSTRKLSWNELWRSEVVIAKKNRGRLKRKTKKTPFQKMLDDRAKRLEMLESQTGEEGGHSSEDSGHCSPEPQNEFLKVHAQLQARRTT